MDEANLCDRIALIQEGKLLSVDTPANIISSYPESLFAIRADQMHLLLKLLQAYDEVLNTYAFGEYVHVSFKQQHVDENRLFAYLRLHGASNIEFQKTAVTVEDSFIRFLKN